MHRRSILQMPMALQTRMQSTVLKPEGPGRHARLPSYAANPIQLLHMPGARGETTSSHPLSVPRPDHLANRRGMATSAVSGDDEPKRKGKPFILDLGLRSLAPEWAKMFNPSTMFQDVSAGITVGCIAVPLSLAIALASGVPAEVGLVTAAVSGIAGGLLGGTTLAVTGPAAAISLLVVGAVTQHGLIALPFITFVCGGLQARPSLLLPSLCPPSTRPLPSLLQP